METTDRGARAGSKWEATWWATHATVTGWITAHKRLPQHNSRRPGGRTVEDRLADWLSRQRKPEARLDDDQIDALLHLPGFSFEPLEERWDARYEQTRKFIADHGRKPGRSAAVALGERRLGDWLRQQQRLVSRNALPYRRVRLLRDLGLPARAAPTTGKLHSLKNHQSRAGGQVGPREQSGS